MLISRVEIPSYRKREEKNRWQVFVPLWFRPPYCSWEYSYSIAHGGRHCHSGAALVPSNDESCSYGNCRYNLRASLLSVGVCGDWSKSAGCYVRDSSVGLSALEYWDKGWLIQVFGRCDNVLRQFDSGFRREVRVLSAGGSWEEDQIDTRCSRDIEGLEKFLFLKNIASIWFQHRRRFWPPFWSFLVHWSRWGSRKCLHPGSCKLLCIGLAKVSWMASPKWIALLAVVESVVGADERAS